MASKLSLDEIITKLVEKYPEEVFRVEESLEPAIRVKDTKLFQVAKELKEDYELNFLSDLTAIDPEEELLRGVYHLMSWEPYRQLRIEVDVPRENPWLPSLTGLWLAADVQEREAHDMFGIIYDGHPNLTRILLSETFEGYPLRKDFVVESRRK